MRGTTRNLLTWEGSCSIFRNQMTQATLFLNHVRSRIAEQGNWSRTARFPKTYKRVERQKRVFLLSREDRRFAVVATNYAEADNRLTALLP